MNKQVDSQVALRLYIPSFSLTQTIPSFPPHSKYSLISTSLAVIKPFELCVFTTCK